jgi:hypothetical protein
MASTTPTTRTPTGPGKTAASPATGTLTPPSLGRSATTAIGSGGAPTPSAPTLARGTSLSSSAAVAASARAFQPGPPSG